jgi:hypothetical protein
MRPGGKDSVLAYDDLEDGLNGFGREVASIAANDICARFGINGIEDGLDEILGSATQIT